MHNASNQPSTRTLPPPRFGDLHPTTKHEGVLVQYRYSNHADGAHYGVTTGSDGLRLEEAAALRGVSVAQFMQAAIEQALREASK